MKPTTTYALIWLSVALAVSVGIIVTGRLIPLWALLIPTLASFEYESKSKTSEDG